MSINRFEDASEPLISHMVKIIPIPIENRYKMSKNISDKIKERGYKFGFGLFSDVVFYRTYSRDVNGRKETFPEVVIRNIEGILSIRKNHFINNGIEWNDDEWSNFAIEMGHMMMDLKFLPPGRGLYCLGSEYSYTRGSVSLNNCGFISTIDGILHSAAQTMDYLSCGCGLGFDTKFKDNNILSLPGCEDCRLNVNRKCQCSINLYKIHDSREGWVKSLFLLLKSYHGNSNCIHFDYTGLREKGEKIKGFGGVSSGHVPLKVLHTSIRHYMECYFEAKIDPYNAIINLCMREKIEDNIQKIKELRNKNILKTYGTTRLIVDIWNSIGICIVSGNIRRSSEIAVGSANDDEFISLKDYEINPERTFIGWMSNNSISMEKQEDFLKIPNITERIKVNGEPGIMNLINVQKFGRIGKKHPIGRESELDLATGVNPCGELFLEDGELCNLCEVFISKCLSLEEMKKAVKFATFYTSTVALLPGHWSNTNRIVSRNRRIGVSLSGIAEYYDSNNPTELTKILKILYKTIRAENTKLALLAGVPASIRVTTVKPSGTISLLAGTSAGLHWPEFQYAIRTIRIASNSKIVPILINAGVKCEDDFYSGSGTKVFSFPIFHGDNTRSAQSVSVWEQAMLQITLQREFADNGISVTLKFNPETEGLILENLLSQMMPIIKGVSCLPHTDVSCYVQAPYQKSNKEEYDTLNSTIKPIDWNLLSNEQTEMPRGCDSDKCMLIH